MIRFGKITTIVALTGILAAAFVTPSEARYRHRGVVGAGVAAGAAVGAAAAANSYSYYYGPFANSPYGYDSYAYEPSREAPMPYYSYGEDRPDGNYGYYNEGIGAVR